MAKCNGPKYLYTVRVVATRAILQAQGDSIAEVEMNLKLKRDEIVFITKSLLQKCPCEFHQKGGSTV